MPPAGPKPLQAVYYRRSDGTEPVNDFIDGLPNEKHKVAVDNQIDRINALCTTAQPDLPFPHSSQVSGQLRELRCHYGKTLYRILYRRSENFVILLHAFVKTTQKIPPGEIGEAQKNWDDFKARMDATKRIRPRAIGHDAP
jgi:phage-related protein